jgi:hypothetical protein
VGPMTRRRMLRLASLLAAVAAPAACAQQLDDIVRPDSAACSVPVLVTFSTAPDDALFAELARASGARLEPRSAITATLYAVTVGADGPDSACAAALERLRSSPRVRSVEPDARRGVRPAQRSSSGAN